MEVFRRNTQKYAYNNHDLRNEIMNNAIFNRERPQNERVLNYTESEQVCKLNTAVPLGITHSKQLCNCKPAKNEYTHPDPGKENR